MAAPRGRFDFLDDRALQPQDLNPEERDRLEQKYVEHFSTTGSRARAANVAGAERMTDKPASLAASARRQADHVLRSPGNAMPGDASVPGSPWYFDHNQAIGEKNAGRVSYDTAIDTSSSMSPLNAPEDERRAVGGLISAQDANASTHITPEIAKTVRAAVAKKPTKARPNGTTGAEFLPDEQVGRQVGFNDLHPKVVAALGSNAVSAKHPQMETDVDFASIRRAGVNVTKGVRGVRGAPLNELSPPDSAPKVHTYAVATKNHIASDPILRDESIFRAKNVVDQLTGRSTQGQLDFDFNGLNDDKFTVTPGHVAHLNAMLPSSGDNAKEGLVPGAVVRMRNLHPSAVGALGSPHNPDDHTRRLAVLSSAHPTVQDSWQNGIHADQANEKVGKTSVLKAGGSEGVGYFTDKTLNSGESVMDSSVGVGRVQPEGLQHAVQDETTRAAARLLRNKAATGLTDEHAAAAAVQRIDNDDHQAPVPDVSSVMTQAVAWTNVRREAGKDPAYQKNQGQNKRVAKSDALRRTRDAAGQPTLPGMEHFNDRRKSV